MARRSPAPPDINPPTEPKKRVRGGVRARLVEEAARLFSAKGYDGVAIDEIVAAAGVNKRMVYHYFGNKDGIYRAAVNHVFASLQTMETGIIESYTGQSDPVGGMRNLMTLYFSFLESHPEFVRILQWENLGEGRHLAEEEGGMSKSPVLGYLEQLLKQGAAAGIFRKGLDPRLVFTSMIGLCLIYFSNRFTLSRSVGLNFKKPTLLREAAQHAEAVLLAGLRSDKKL